MRMRQLPSLIRSVILYLGASLAFVCGAGCASLDHEKARETRVYVVRHAEKEAGVPDPGLTYAGERRAEALAELCARAGVVAVYSTAYRRTMETAGATAARVGAHVDTSFGPRDEARLAERVRGVHAGGCVLVVGHSNTVGAIVAALGAERPADLGEDEYDRLFIVTIAPDGRATLERRRYGAE